MVLIYYSLFYSNNSLIPSPSPKEKGVEVLSLGEDLGEARMIEREQMN